MRHHYMLWTSQFTMIVTLAFAIWWLLEHIHGMPDYKLFVALVAMTGYVLNHFRWWNLRRGIDNPDLLEKFDYFVMVNYGIFLLIIALVDIRR